LTKNQIRHHFQSNLGNVVSPFDKGKPPHPVPLTTNEQYSYFSLWCMMACPLNISSELPSLDEFTLRLICNTEMIAVNQDKLGQCAEPVEMNEDHWVLKKTLTDGSVVVGFFDLSDQENTLSVTWQELGIEGKKAVRDLWRQKDIGEYNDKIEVKVSPMGCAVFNLK
jgi:alpha-galactosidase